MAEASRRRLLVLLASAVVPWPTWRAACARGAVRSGADAPRRQLKRLLEATFSDLNAARTLGRRHVATCPDAVAETMRLADRLAAARPATDTDLRRLIARFRSEDLRNRRLALVDGWVLPRIEAEVCALTVLL